MNRCKGCVWCAPDPKALAVPASKRLLQRSSAIAMMVALEFGYRARERGESLEAARASFMKETLS